MQSVEMKRRPPVATSDTTRLWAFKVVPLCECRPSLLPENVLRPEGTFKIFWLEGWVLCKSSISHAAFIILNFPFSEKFYSKCCFLRWKFLGFFWMWCHFDYELETKSSKLSSASDGINSWTTLRHHNLTHIWSIILVQLPLAPSILSMHSLLLSFQFP